MPFIFEYYCTEKCGLKIGKYGGPYMYLKTAEKEILLPHPGEDDLAKSLTGKDVDQLMKEDQIFFKHEKFCLSCLKRKTQCQCENGEFLEIPELEERICPQCNKGKIKKKNIGIS